MKPKSNRADDVFWIFGVASLGVSVYAYSTLSTPAFYASACLIAIAFLAWAAGHEDDS